MADQDFNIKVVTTADTSGLRQTSAEMDAIARRQAEAEAKWARSPINPKNQTGTSGKGEVTSGLGSFVAPTALIAIGYEFVSQLSKAAGEIQKISDELNKQGAQIVDNALKFSELAKFATTEADVLKVGEGALKGVEVAHKNLLDISGKELSIWQKIADVWAAGFKDKGPIAQALELQQAQAAQNYQMERSNAIHEITLAQRVKDDLAAKSYADKIVYLTDKINEEEEAQRRAGVANVEAYLKAGAAAENYRKILAGVTADEKKREAAKSQKSEGVVAKGVQQTEDEFARSQQKAAEQHHAERMAKIQQLKEAEATGDDEKAKSLKDELSSDRFARDQRKEALQRYSANQEDLMEREGGSPDALGVLGTGGATRKKYLKAQAELADIYEQERKEKHPEQVADQKKRQAELDRDLEAQRGEKTATFKTAEQIGRENAERAAAEANERAGRGKAPAETKPVEQTKPEAKPSSLPSPDVVRAVEQLGQKFDRYWS